ncbi:MAG: hypothetical protein ACD_75C01243G0002 [uncultured bacterium]|nr:MAG: hypothetical protein ACD_75C01243G0002 [uncultured bacterium]
MNAIVGLGGFALIIICIAVVMGLRIVNQYER